MTKITKRIVDAVRPSGKEVFLWDDETPGFGLRVKLTGAKSFIIQYRNAQGRSRRLTLGRYGVLTVDEARRKARLSLASVLAGEDPAQANSWSEVRSQSRICAGNTWLRLNVDSSSRSA